MMDNAPITVSEQELLTALVERSLPSPDKPQAPWEEVSAMRKTLDCSPENNQIISIDCKVLKSSRLLLPRAPGSSTAVSTADTA